MGLHLRRLSSMKIGQWPSYLASQSRTAIRRRLDKQTAIKDGQPELNPIDQVILRASQDYKIRPYGGPMIVCFSGQRPHSDGLDGAECWPKLAIGRFESHTLDGPHTAIFQELQLEQLGVILRNCLS